MKKIVDRIYNNGYYLIIISFVIQFYLFRTSVPFFKYPFIFFLFILISLMLLTLKDKIFSIKREFLSEFIYICILSLILVLAFIFSSKIYLSVFKDIINVAILFTLFYLLDKLVNKKEDFNRFYVLFNKIIFLFAIVISIIQILNIFNYPVESGVKIDYNFSLLSTFFGIVIILSLKVERSLTKVQNYLIDLSFLLFYIHIILTGSRRGIITLTVIIFFLIIAQFFTISKNRGLMRKLGLGSRNILILILSLTLIIISLFRVTSCYVKNRTLDFIGVHNIHEFKINLSLSLHKYLSIYNNSIDFNEVHKKIWTQNFDPRDPECGWYFNKGKRVYPLTGKNSEILPQNIVGLSIDLSSFKSVKNKRKNFIIKTIKEEGKKKYRVEVFCYVSKDYDGGRLGIAIGKKYRDFYNLDKAFYDLNYKESWQKLSLDFMGKSENIPILFSLTKENKRRNSFKGNIILADLRFYTLNDDSIFLDNNLNYNKRISLNNLPSCIDINAGYLYIQNANLFDVNMNNLIHAKDYDPIRNLTAKIILEDTTYYPYCKNLLIDTVYSKFTGPRINRWRFAWQIFSKEYNWKEKVFGGGFEYLNWFGYYFKLDKTRNDWPHNPFLSVLLYSGIIGLMVYIIVLLRAIMLYIKYRKEYFIFFIFFLVAFFFAFFSSNSPFTPPVWGFFLIFPYFLHSVHKKIESRG